MFRKKSKIAEVLKILPDDIKYTISKLPEYSRENAEEIRLRLARPATLTIGGNNFFLHSDATLSNDSKGSVIADKSHLEYIFRKTFKESVHSFKREIIRGYGVISGGSRVGFCGNAVLDPRNNFCVENINSISSVNIRIAGEIIGCAYDIYRKVFGTGLKNILIAGPPCSGKTTILRDLTRLLGSRYRVSLIDERNEISSTANGMPENDIGELTDVFSNYNKYEGIMSAVKVMSPQILVCDEIGSQEDLIALEYGVNSGVKLCTTCHAGSVEEALSRNTISTLVQKNCFDTIILLGSGENIGEVKEIKSLEVEKCLSSQEVFY